MQRRLLVCVTVSWIAGNAIACMYSGRELLLIWIGLSIVLAAVLLILRVPVQRGLLLWVTLTIAGLYWEWNDSHNSSQIPSIFHHTVLESAISATEQGESVVEAQLVVEDQSVVIEGNIASALKIDGDRVQFQMKMSQIQADNQTQPQALGELVLVQIRLAVVEEQSIANQWQRGDLIRLQGTLKQPSPARNYGGFDYRRYLHTQRIHWIVKANGINAASVTPPSGWNQHTLLRWNDALRNKLGGQMDAVFTSPVQSGYMKSLVLGVTEDMDAGVYDEFTQLGLTHVLAISGMHVAVFTAGLSFLCRLIRLPREHTLLLMLWVVPGYVLISGGSPSVVRAGIMAMLGLYAARKGILKDGLNILCAAALVMLLWEPYFLLSVSFQLSFLVTAGLIIYGPILRPLFHGWKEGIGGAASVTITAQLVSFPLTIYYFNQFSLLSLAANFALVPVITSIVMPLGAAALLLGFVWQPAAVVVVWPAERLNELSFVIIEWVNGYGGAVNIWPSVSLPWLCAYFVILYVLLRQMMRWIDACRSLNSHSQDMTAPLSQSNERYGWVRSLFHSRRPTHAGAANTMSSLPLAAVPEWSVTWRPPAAAYARSRMTKGAYIRLTLTLLSFIILLVTGYQTPTYGGAGLVQFLDVGQGDSILITTPAGKHILVDAGGTMDFAQGKNAWRKRKKPYEVGAQTVVPLLKQRGVHQLEAVIVTHGDEDHAGGMRAVLEQIPVKAFIFNGTLTGKAPDQLITLALAKQIPIYSAYSGLTLEPDSHTNLRFLAPDMRGEEVPTRKEQNAESVVFYLEMGGVSFLLTGDTVTSVEKSMVEALMQKEGHTMIPAKMIDVLKVAHHGSKTSTSMEWLSYWKPRNAVISAGVNNAYGHPNEQVLKRIEAYGSRIFRTDLMGEVQFRAKDGLLEYRHKLVQ
ncbi:ComEC/Rec2 family competence protein [Paenibacillus massiliensis]|uniref:ComEC/Rec2 family competence protein n=1 Tax=Paenibacillus massiliensis TaxID=225917 RepID=UPI000405833D|nr:ComEC/Rec2 family competence protein [Paenibacillus massiliensis]